MLAIKLALSTPRLGLGNLSQNPLFEKGTSGGYQLLEQADYGVATDKALTKLDNFPHPPNPRQRTLLPQISDPLTAKPSMARSILGRDLRLMRLRPILGVRLKSAGCRKRSKQQMA